MNEINAVLEMIAALESKRAARDLTDDETDILTVLYVRLDEIRCGNELTEDTE